jgi:hypothetical protein
LRAEQTGEQPALDPEVFAELAQPKLLGDLVDPVAALVVRNVAQLAKHYEVVVTVVPVPADLALCVLIDRGVGGKLLGPVLVTPHQVVEEGSLCGVQRGKDAAGLGLQLWQGHAGKGGQLTADLVLGLFRKVLKHFNRRVKTHHAGCAGKSLVWLLVPLAALLLRRLWELAAEESPPLLKGVDGFFHNI